MVSFACLCATTSNLVTYKTSRVFRKATQKFQPSPLSGASSFLAPTEGELRMQPFLAASVLFKDLGCNQWLHLSVKEIGNCFFTIFVWGLSNPSSSRKKLVKLSAVFCKVSSIWSCPGLFTTGVQEYSVLLLKISCKNTSQVKLAIQNRKKVWCDIKMSRLTFCSNFFSFLDMKKNPHFRVASPIDLWQS